MRNSIFSVIGFVVPIIGMFFSFRIFDQHLGRESTGIYLLATSFATSFTFLGFGIAGAVTKFIAEANNDQRKSRLFTVSLMLYSLVGVLFFLVIWLLSDAIVRSAKLEAELNEVAKVSVIIGGLIMPIVMANEIALAVVKGLRCYKHVAMSKFVLTIIAYIICPICILLFPLNALWLVVFVGFGYVFSFVFLFFAIKRSGVLLVTSVLVNGILLQQYIKKMMSFGAVLALVAIGAFCYFQLQRYLVAFWYGAAALAIYMYAFSLVSRVHGIISSATEVLFPMIAAKKSKNEIAKIRLIYWQSLAGSASVAFLVCGFLWLFSENIVNLWLGNNNAKEIAILIKWFSVGYFFLSLSPVPYHVINGLGMTKLNLVNIILRCVANGLFLMIFLNYDDSMLSIVRAFASAAFLIDFMIWPIFVDAYVLKKYFLK